MFRSTVSLFSMLFMFLLVASFIASCGKKSLAPVGIGEEPIINVDDDPDYADYVDEQIPEPENRYASALTKMPAPTAVTASGGTYNDRVKVYWTHPVGEQPTTYYVYRSNAPDEPVPDYIGGCSYPNRVYYDMTATPGTKYYYKVKSHKAGFNDSVFSNEHMGFMGTKMNPPLNVKASDSQFVDKIHVIWSAPSGVAPTVYYIYRSETANNQSPTYIGARSYPGTYYDDTTAVAGVTYYYKVKSHKSGYNDSVFSNENAGKLGEWVFETVESDGFAGYYNSIDVGSDFVPHIVSYSYTSNDLTHASYDGSTWNQDIIENMSLNDNAIVKVGSDNIPRVGYWDDGNYDVKYAMWNGTDWDIQTIEAGHYPSDLSMVLDANDYPHMTYNDDIDSGALRYARWNGTDWSFTNVHEGSEIGYRSSLALDADDNPHITYVDDDNYYTYYARKIGNWWIHEMLDSTNNWTTSLAVGSDGYPRVAVARSPIWYLVRDDIKWNKELLAENASWCIGLVLDSQDNPRILYYNLTNTEIRYASWNGTDWDLTTVDPNIDGSNVFLSFALDDLGRPHISYMDDINFDLKYATIR